ncbi:hypothetical protein NFJ02_30g77960 [Pycnococcus provasolii]
MRDKTKCALAILAKNFQWLHAMATFATASGVALSVTQGACTYVANAMNMNLVLVILQITTHVKTERQSLDRRHNKQRARSDLLLAAIVRKTIISEHGSVESARETYTSNQSSWTEYLRTTASRGHALQALVMAYIV